MKLVSINTVCNGSTGKIMGSISREARNDGFEVFCIYGRRKGYTDIPCKKIGGPFSFLHNSFLNDQKLNLWDIFSYLDSHGSPSSNDRNGYSQNMHNGQSLVNNHAKSKIFFLDIHFLNSQIRFYS